MTTSPDDPATDPQASDGDAAERNRRRKLLAAGGVVAAAALLGAFLLLGGDDDEGRPSKGTGVTSGVSPERLRYPQEVEGKVGEDARFANDDDRPHTFTADRGEFDSGTLQPGEEFAVSTLPAGSYPYHCSIHPDLTGTLTVVE